jgi:putative C-S lyase
MKYSFDEKIDRFNTPSAKFHKGYLKDIFGTEDLYPFWIADEDFKTPPQILNAFNAKIEEGLFGYEYKPTTFMPALQNWYKTRFHCELDTSWVQFTPTIMSTMAMALDLFTKEGDGVIVQPPVYMEFESTIKRTQRKLISNPLKLIDLHYEMDFKLLELEAQKSASKALMICNPHNPGGRVWTKNELQKVVNICVANDILILADEIHADIIFSPAEFTSLLAFPEIHDQLVVCYSPAKVFNIASITDSLAIIPNADLREKFTQLRLRYNLGRTYAFSRIAMETGFTESAEWVDELNNYVERNVAYIATFLKENIPEIELVKQEGTYLVWLKVDALPLQGKKLIQFLAKEAKMGLNDGAAFGPSGTPFVRMNISCPAEIVKEAMANLKTAVTLISK